MKTKLHILFVLGAFALFALSIGALPRRVVSVSIDEWRQIKMGVETNGYYDIKKDNVLIVVTNGLPSMDLVTSRPSLPSGGRPRMMRRPLPRPMREPGPYQGQTTH